MKHQYLAITLLLLSTPLMADESDVEFMVLEKCTSCHESEVYSREDRKVKSIESLGMMVRACNTNTGAQWFDDEVNLAIDYLNKHYYKFGE